MEHKYWREHREEINRKNLQRYHSNKEKYLEMQKDYYKREKEKILTHNKEWILKNKEYVYSYRMEWKRGRQHNLRMKVLSALGGKCVRCGIDDWRVLQIDHVNGGGRKDVLRNENRAKYYNNILKEPPYGKFQILCANCNWIKRYERGEFDQVKRHFNTRRRKGKTF